MSLPDWADLIRAAQATYEVAGRDGNLGDMATAIKAMSALGESAAEEVLATLARYVTKAVIISPNQNPTAGEDLGDMADFDISCCQHRSLKPQSRQ